MLSKPISLSLAIAVFICIDVMSPFAQAEQIILTTAPLKGFLVPRRETAGTARNTVSQVLPTRPEKPASPVEKAASKPSLNPSSEPQLEYPADWPMGSNTLWDTGPGKTELNGSTTLLNARAQKSAITNTPKQRLYNVRIVSSSAALAQRSTANTLTAAAKNNTAAVVIPKPVYFPPASNPSGLSLACGFCDAVHRMVSPAAYNQAANDPSVASLNNALNIIRSVLH